MYLHVFPIRLIHVNVWQKPLQYCKVISLQLIKINGKKIKFMKIFFLYFLIISLYVDTDQSRMLPSLLIEIIKI